MRVITENIWKTEGSIPGIRSSGAACEHGAGFGAFPGLGRRGIPEKSIKLRKWKIIEENRRNKKE